MTRVAHWERLLAAAIDTARAKPFVWGVHDCPTFAFEVHMILTGGEDIAYALMVLAREGAARDHLNALLKDTAPCSGELTALWVYLTAKDAFGYNVFKSFTSSHGTSAEQRRRALPYFLRWIPDFTEQEAPSKL